MKLTTDELMIQPLATESEAKECARMMSTTEPWLTFGYSYENCLKIVQNQTREVYVARINQSLVGFLILNMQGSFTGYIQNLCVHPEHRGKGIGSMLINWAEKRIFKESPNVFICVSSFNPKAFNLYQRLGFKVVGELKDFVVAGHSEIMLRKSIGSLCEFRRNR